MNLTQEPPLKLCSADHQRQEWLARKQNEKIADITRSLIALSLFAVVGIKPLNSFAEWAYRLLQLPNLDPTGLEANFKELNLDKDFNRTLKDGDQVLSYVITSPFGDRVHPVTGERKPHTGVDINTPEGTPIYAIGRPRNWLDAGKMFDSEFIEVVCSEDPYKGKAATLTSTLLQDYKFHFFHLKSCNAGGYASGAIIGETGNTGTSTAPHLHFAVELKGQMIDPPIGFLLWALQGKEPQTSEPIAVSSDLKPLLDTIRFAEGTDKEDGYQTMFSGAKFTDFSKHPDTVHSTIFKGKTLASAAAGAYQYMPKTWARVSKAINAIDFSPANQDRGAIFLIKERGAYELAKQGEIKKSIFYLCKEWASLPCFEGDTQGAYGQAVKPIDELMQVYKSKSGKKQ